MRGKVPFCREVRRGIRIKMRIVLECGFIIMMRSRGH